MLVTYQVRTGPCSDLQKTQQWVFCFDKRYVASRGFRVDETRSHAFLIFERKGQQHDGQCVQDDQ